MTTVLDLSLRMHDQAAAAIDKADTKAGFVATLNTALLAGVLTVAHLDQLHTAGRVLVSLMVMECPRIPSGTR